jgi:hypothetical protein
MGRGGNKRVGSRKGFHEGMKNRGFGPSKSQEVRGYDGVDLVAEANARADFR